MTVLATCTFTWEDSEGKTTTRSYTARDNEPTDGEVQALAADAQALSAWSLIKAVVTRTVDVTAQSDAAEAGSSIQRDASLVYNPTSLLRASLGGSYTFRMPQYKDALLSPTGTIDPTAAVFDSWTENFDDGAGVAAVVGDWFVGNQAELVEEEDPDEGFQNKA
jgi:hypothetical protein